MTIGFLIQHHPSRSHLLPTLLSKIDGEVEVVTDPSPSQIPNPWRCYKECLRRASPIHSHTCILQDDVVPAVNFAGAVRQIAEAHADTPVCLFLARLPRDTKPRPEQAMKMGRRYVQLSYRSFMPIVAVLWPRHKLVEFADWAEANPGLPGQREPRSDDAMGGRWKMIERQTVLACVPSIVEHPDVVPSTIGRMAHWGKDKGRVAAFLADDALDYDWSMP